MDHHRQEDSTFLSHILLFLEVRRAEGAVLVVRVRGLSSADSPCSSSFLSAFFFMMAASNFSFFRRISSSCCLPEKSQSQ